MHSRALLTACFFLAQCACVLAQSADYATISKESRETVIQTLSLDKDQTVTLDDLIDGYVTDALTIAQECSRRIAEVEASGDPFTARFAARKELEVERDRDLIANRERLFDDLLLVLDESQTERVEIARKRVRRAPMFEELSGDASGFTADPAIVAQELALYDLLDPDELERFEGAMRAYDNVIDQNLDAFLEIRTRFARDMADPIEENRDEARDQYVDSMIGAIIDLRSAHASRLKAIAPSLPRPIDEEWLTTALRLSHPAVFSATWGERVIGSLLGNDALVPDERSDVRKIAEEFAPQYDRARLRLARTIEQAEGRVTVEQAKRSSFITVNDPEVVEAREALTAIDKRVRRLIENALAPGIRDLVPPLPGG